MSDDHIQEQIARDQYGMDDLTLKPGWLLKTVRDASAEVATWPEEMRGSLVSALDDEAVLGGIKKLRQRLHTLEGEARRRGLLP